MKKIFFVLVAASMTMAAQAKILRVSNVEGSSAPYTSVQSAIDAASEGDTIMVDASSTQYDGISRITINKRVVLLGPGYWLQENGIIQEGGGQASVYSMTINAKGTVVKGMTIYYQDGIAINSSQVVINRCWLRRGSISLGGSNCIIHQNFCRAISGIPTSNHQITNNIISGLEFDASSYMSGISDSYIAYNTFIGGVPWPMDDSNWGLKNCTIEKNIFKDVPTVHSSSSYGDNYVPDVWAYETTMIDKEILNLSKGLAYGAFAGNDPYILSGVPAGPVVQDLIVPTTVEKGSKMNVTIKVGVVK